MKSLILFITILFINSSYAQSYDENKSLFKLGSTPFISKSKINLNLSYGVNYGSPSFIIQQWVLPNDKRKIIFTDIIGSLSIENEIEVYVKYIEGHSLAYNYSHIGVNYKNDKYRYGIKWKVINSDDYIPGASIELNSHYPISLSVGSSAERFKYYVSIDWGFYYILLPYRYSIGLAYSFIENFNLFIEGNYQDSWDGRIPSQSARTGIDVSLFNYVHLDIALFYFGFNFTDIIPGRNGLTWQNPDYIMAMPEKNNYFLLSSSVYVNIDILK